MSKSKRLRMTSLFILLALVVGMFAGCGTAAPAASTSPSESVAASESASVAPESSAAEATPEKLEPVELLQYIVGSEQPDIQTVVDAMNVILKEKINATLNLKLIDWGSYDQKMKVIIAAAEPFDICFTAPWINNYYDNVNKGAFLPMDDLMLKYAPNATKAIPQSYWDATKVNGKIYGFLNYQIFARTDAIAIRNDVAKELGFDPTSVKTLRDLEPFLQAVTDKKKDMMTINIAGSGGFNVWYERTFNTETIISQDVPGAIQMDDMNAKVVNQFASPEYKEMFQIVRDWYQKGFFPKDIATVTDTTGNRRAGKYAVETEGTFKPGGLAELASMMNLTTGDFTEVLMSKTYASTSGIIATMHAISKNTANPERAMMYLELINTDKDLYNTMCFGVKDKHYTVDADGYVEAIQNGGWNPITDWEYGNQFNALYRKGNEKGNWDKTVELNQSAVMSPIIGFAFDPTPVKTEIAQCQAVSKEYMPLLGCGSADLDTKLPEFLDKLNKAGSETIVAEIQKQIDAWKATK